MFQTVSKFCQLAQSLAQVKTWDTGPEAHRRSWFSYQFCFSIGAVCPGFVGSFMNTLTELTLDVQSNLMCPPDPTQGPRIVFFSGGTALNDIAPVLAGMTENATYLVTPFDNGGSSQKLRKALSMPAVGDLRSRLVALAGGAASSPLAAALAYRLPKGASRLELPRDLVELYTGRHPVMSALGVEHRGFLLTHLRHTVNALPKWFDYRHASIGNLVITGGYLLHGRQFDPVVTELSKRLGIRGQVALSVVDTLQLAVDLADGSQVVGQDRLTGKEHPPIASSVSRIYLHDTIGPREAHLMDATRVHIAAADVICYPPGSFYSSVLANLLPKGTGQAIANSSAKKVYCPSLGHDPECIGLSLRDQVLALLDVLRADAGPEATVADLLSAVIVDLRVSEGDCAQIETEFGVACLRRRLGQDGTDRYDATRFSQVLMTLV